MNQELSFFLKIMRNALILSGLYFVSVWAVGDLSWAVCKPVIIFLLTYIFTELARRYGLAFERNKKASTLVF